VQWFFACFFLTSKKLPKLSKANGFLFCQAFFFDRDLKEKSASTFTTIVG